jgi:hypothetical protein
LLFICGLLLGTIGWRHRRDGDRFAIHWLALAAIIVYLSLDEAANLHEMLIVPLRRRLDTHGILYFAWVLPGGVAVAAFGLTYLRFLLHLDQPTRRRFLISAAMYLGGALGMELVGGALAEAHSLDSLLYIAAMTIEESLEMFGAAFFAYTLLTYLATRCSDVRLAVRA